ncbi:MAG TPA: hypothetical protein VNC39_16335 [Acidocella sp.]|jgi:hypothetical protein|uniref:hypothetical protein n=1 Tax=Acidocella sp. TaxID=50710 RepID=UPI002BA0926F|nr:hypothetical protein [Acidocella sp.]HVE23537.1 hypothetical protein [Acidocella sp.]
MTLRFPWETVPNPAASGRVTPHPDERPAKRRGRRPATGAVSTSDEDWFYHQLTITGPQAVLDSFAAAACGAGVVPWVLDYAVIEEDIFNLAVAQPVDRRGLTVDGCHILARQFRERVEAHHAKALAVCGRSRASPFDLFVLLPVPVDLLQLGPRHPCARSWLATRWGPEDNLRQVTRQVTVKAPRRLPVGHGVLGYTFLSYASPAACAINTIATAWSGLNFDLRYRPTSWSHGWMT